MENLEHLLNALLQKGWKPFGLEHITNIVHENKKIVCRQNGKHWFNYSLRELASQESLLWQFIVKNKFYKNNNDIYPYIDRIIEDAYHIDLVLEKEEYTISNHQYRLIQSSLVPEEDLAQFLLDNIIIEGY